MFCWYAFISAVKLIFSLKSAKFLTSCCVKVRGSTGSDEWWAVDLCITDETEARSSSIQSEASSRLANPSSSL